MVSVIIYKYHLEEFSEKMSSYPEKNSQQIFKMEIDVCVPGRPPVEEYVSACLPKTIDGIWTILIKSTKLNSRNDKRERGRGAKPGFHLSVSSYELPSHPSFALFLVYCCLSVTRLANVNIQYE